MNAILDTGSDWNGQDVVILREGAITSAYSTYRELGLSPKGAGNNGEALVAALRHAHPRWIIEVRYVSMTEMPAYTGFIRLAGPNQWVIDVRDDLTAGGRDLTIAHEVAHILNDDVPPEGRARPRVIPITPPEVKASAFAMTMGRLFEYGDPEGEREAALSRLAATHRHLLRNLGPRRVR